MAEKLVTTERLQAGADYLASLKKLGFEPEGAFWSVRPNEPATLELSLFSSVVDRIGSRRVFEALFEAYDHARTPRSFDPWQVALYSPSQFFYDAVIGGRLFDDARKGEGATIVSEEILLESGTQRVENGIIVEIRNDYSVRRLIERDWLYWLPPKTPPKNEVVETQLRRFKRFEREVKLAA